MSTLKKVIFLIIAVIIILLVAIGGVMLWSKTKGSSPKAPVYSVVYLTSGEIYVGQLKTDRKMTLTNPYLLQVVKDAKDPKQNNFQLTPLSEAVWAPQELYINKEQVLFYGPLAENSRAMQGLRSKSQ